MSTTALTADTAVLDLDMDDIRSRVARQEQGEPVKYRTQRIGSIPQRV